MRGNLVASDPDSPLVDTATRFDIASTSKQFTGFAVESLIAKGEIRPEQPVNEIVASLSELRDAVTVGRLLNHTSGLPDYGDLLTAEYDEPASQTDALEALARVQPEPAKIDTFEYSNSNYVILAEVVRQVAGVPLDQYLAESVFDPLGLDMTLNPELAGDIDAAVDANIAVGADWPSRWTQIGDGSVFTSPLQLVAWSGQYWNQTVDGADLSELGEPRAADDSEGGRYGSGVSFGETGDGVATISHSGAWAGTATEWEVRPEERLAVAISCNTEDDWPSDSPATDLLDAWIDAG